MVAMLERASIGLVDSIQVPLGVHQRRAVERIETLDLSDIKRKLMEPEPHGYGWSQEQVDEGEVWYRRYLTIILHNNANAGCVPNLAIDKFWHCHILDTEAYANDCQRVFGHFLHHHQYLGMNGDGDVRDSLFAETNAVYQKYFGEDCTAMKHLKPLAGVTMCEGTSCIGSGCRNRKKTSRGKH